MWTLVAIAAVLPLLLVWLWGLFEGERSGDDATLWRRWTRVLKEEPPSPEELASLLGPAIELVQRAAVEAEGQARLASAPLALAAVVDEAHSRSARVVSVLLTWTVGLARLDERVDGRRLPLGVLRLRRLRLLAWAERPLAVVGHLCRARPATHMVTLHWALRVLVRALREAQHAAPALRARLLADIASDFALIQHDIVSSHAQALEPFLRWRASQPALAGAEDACQTPSGWY